MALIDESFWSDELCPGISPEHNKTIKDNVMLLQDSFIKDTGKYLSYACTFTGPIGRVGSLLVNKCSEKLDDSNKERIYEKIKIIAKNEKSAELLKSLHETKYGETPQVIILSELIKRQQDEITELSKKYDKQTIQTKYNTIIINKENQQKDEIDDNITKLNNWIQSSNKEKFDINQKQVYHDTFHFLSQVGHATNFNELTTIANLAQSSLIIHESINSIATNLANGVALVGLINPITSILTIGMGLFNMFNKSNEQIYMNIIIEQLNNIKQQLNSIQSEMREQFSNVFKYLDNITEKLHKQQTIALNIYYKTEQIEKSIQDLNTVCEYYGKQNLLQDLYRTIYKITQGNSDYFQTIGRVEFNSIFMDIFYWLENHCFDYGINGYIYAKTQNVVNNFNMTIYNRIGYLASLLNFPNAQNIVNPTIFNICVSALEILIHKGLPHYGYLPLPYDKIIPIINKTNLTKQFIEYSRQPVILQNLINEYDKTIDQLKTALFEWVDINTQKYGINICDSDDEIISTITIDKQPLIAKNTDLNQKLQQLPVYYVAVNDILSYRYKICKLAKKLNLGEIDYIFSYNFQSNIYKRNVVFDVYIQFNFILNGIKYDMCLEKWQSTRSVDIFLCGFIENNFKNNWVHNYTSDWKLVEYTVCDIANENIIKKACLDKLTSIRNELTDISSTIGTRINMLCDKLDEQYIIISKLFELNDIILIDELYCGNTIKKQLDQVINHKYNYFGYNILKFCDIIKNKLTQLQPIYKESTILNQLNKDCDKLNELSADIVHYQNEYENIQKDKIIKEEQLIHQKVNENTDINHIGMQIGRSLTINAIIKKLENMNKFDEAQIIKTNFEKELVYTDIEFQENKELIGIFNSAFCNGSSMALLEISFSLQNYMHTVCDVQKIGHKILSELLTSNRSISYTMNKFLE